MLTLNDCGSFTLVHNFELSSPWTGSRICRLLLRLTLELKLRTRSTVTAPTVCMVAPYTTMSWRRNV